MDIIVNTKTNETRTNSIWPFIWVVISIIIVSLIIYVIKYGN